MDKVRVVCKDEEVVGIQIPSEDPKFVVLKLDSGYNIGIKKSNVKKIEKLGKVDKKDVKVKAAKKGKGKKVTIMIFGGTITSKVDYSTGGVTSKFTSEEFLNMFPELAEVVDAKVGIVKNIMSDQMRFGNYNQMAKEIEKEVKKGADGIILTHGTDALHVTAAALNFILEGLPIPVVITGSQRSSDRPSSDGNMNLISSAIFIANSNEKGVFTCFHENSDDSTCLINHGCAVRKMHTSRRDAFRPVNQSAIAQVNYEKRKIKKMRSVKLPETKFKLKLLNPKLKVGFHKIHNNMYSEELKAYEKFDGLLLEVFALGQAPMLAQDEFMKENVKVGEMIKKLAKKIPVAVASQCIYGRVDMNVYSEGRELKKAGVLGNDLNMTPETAFIKLAWLLSNYKDKEEVERLFSENLRGEISERTEKETFLV